MEKLTFTLQSVDTHHDGLVTLTVEQAQTAIEIVESDIAASAFGEIEFANVKEMEFYLRRAQLLQRLQAAISAAKLD
jgi:hypothetical protein